jgi:trehalose-6-phosphate synthase
MTECQDDQSPYKRRTENHATSRVHSNAEIHLKSNNGAYRIMQLPKPITHLIRKISQHRYAAIQAYSPAIQSHSVKT